LTKAIVGATNFERARKLQTFRLDQYRSTHSIIQLNTLYERRS